MKLLKLGLTVKYYTMKLEFMMAYLPKTLKNWKKFYVPGVDPSMGLTYDQSNNSRD